MKRDTVPLYHILSLNQEISETKEETDTKVRQELQEPRVRRVQKARKVLLVCHNGASVVSRVTQVNSGLLETLVLVGPKVQLDSLA